MTNIELKMYKKLIDNSHEGIAISATFKCLKSDFQFADGKFLSSKTYDKYFSKTGFLSSQFIYANKTFANMIGFKKPDELADAYVNEFCDEENYMKMLKEHLERIRTNKKISQYEVEIIDRNKKVLHWAISASAIEYKGVNGGLIYVRDISKQKELQWQINQMDKIESIGQLSSGIAHNSNNLNMIILNSALMLRDVIDNYDLNGDVIEVHKYINNIITSAESSSELSDKLSNFSRTSVNHKTKVNLHKLLNSSGDLLITNSQKVISIDIQTIAEKYYVYVDEVQLQSVLINLLINAKDSIKQSGEIKISTYNTDESIIIELSDTGHGIPENKLSKIFNPFYTTKEQGKGTGMGLSSALGIITELHGTLKVKETSINGTTFIIELPLYKE